MDGNVADFKAWLEVLKEARLKPPYMLRLGNHKLLDVDAFLALVRRYEERRLASSRERL